MIVLVINCGSSSLKYQVLNMQDANNYSLLAKGLVERIGLEMGEVTHRPAGKDKVVIDKPVPDHTEGIKSVLELLTDPKCGVLKSLNEIQAVGHRVAHGGELFPESCLIDDKVLRAGSPAQPRQPPRYPCRQDPPARSAPGRSLRHLVPSDYA